MIENICIILVCFAITVSIIKRSRRLLINAVLSVIAMMIARLIGRKFGIFFLSYIADINLETLSEKVSHTIASVLGTLIVFIGLMMFLKPIFKLVDGKFKQKVHLEVVDRLCGALVGLLIGFSMVFSESVMQVFRRNISEKKKRDHQIFNITGSSIIFRLVRNLN